MRGTTSPEVCGVTIEKKRCKRTEHHWLPFANPVWKYPIAIFLKISNYICWSLRSVEAAAVSAALRSMPRKTERGVKMSSLISEWFDFSFSFHWQIGKLPKGKPRSCPFLLTAAVRSCWWWCCPCRKPLLALCNFYLYEIVTNCREVAPIVDERRNVSSEWWWWHASRRMATAIHWVLG